MSLSTPWKMKYAASIVAAMVFALPGWACPIPVYQYSLEWWEEDPYEIYIFDNGHLSAEQEALIERLQTITEGRGGDDHANLRLRLVQSEDEARLKAHSALRGQDPESFPYVAVYYPSMSSNARTPVWMGPLTAENVDALIDSPMRSEITQLLVDRVSVVWLLLESGDTRVDNEAYDRLTRELPRLQETLVPPDPTAYGLDIPITPVKFETRRLSRDKEDEQMFIRMLMNTEADLEDYAGEPILFPIFGRGLVMNALVGRGINPYMLLDTAEFLTGACSCTVKSLNPGVDLLTAVDWGAVVEPMSEEFTTEPGGLGGFIDSREEAGSL